MERVRRWSKGEGVEKKRKVERGRNDMEMIWRWRKRGGMVK